MVLLVGAGSMVAALHKFSASTARVERHLRGLRSPATPCSPSPVYCPAYPVYLIPVTEHTLWLICLTWLSARENSHVPSNSKKPSVVMEAMMMTCQRKAITQRGPYSHNSAQTAALTVCTSCTRIRSHWFKPIRDNWQNVNWVDYEETREQMRDPQDGNVWPHSLNLPHSKLISASRILFLFPSSERG